MNISRNRLFVGIVVLLLGSWAFLAAMGYGQSFDFWGNIIPILFIVFGIYGLSKGNSVVWSLGLSLVGIWWVVNNTTNIDDKLFMPGILIIIGVAFVLGAFRGKRYSFNPKDIDVNSMPDYFCAFGGLNVSNTSQNFVSASVSTAFGGIDLDLRNAKIQGDEAVIDTFAAFGGIDIKVPTDWVVVTKGLPIFGGFDNKAVNNSEIIGKRLVVKGAALFGGVSIKN